MNDEPLVIGPFDQLLSMDHLPIGGPIKDDQLEILKESGLVVQGEQILEIGFFNQLKNKYSNCFFLDYPAVALPGWIDSHTHICFAGSRASDYALRLSGKTYQEIAAAGGGILDSVKQTREAKQDELIDLTIQRAKRQLQKGITTCEVKSGYGLTLQDEIKMLEVIQKASNLQPIDLIPTCLAAHICPPEFSNPSEYLEYLIAKLFPLLKEHNLTQRIDIFVESGAFSTQEAKNYLQAAKKEGFQVCVHADQFSRGGAILAAEVGALSADHLEVSEREDFVSLCRSGTIPIVLPGASLGLGLPFPRVREMLDAGLPVVIASDWNPGSAPMGNLLTEAAILGAYQKLTMAETIAAMTSRAARALALNDRGVLKAGMRADCSIFACKDYREILYHQGSLKPKNVIVKGKIWTFSHANIREIL